MKFQEVTNRKPSFTKELYSITILRCLYYTALLRYLKVLYTTLPSVITEYAS